MSSPMLNQEVLMLSCIIDATKNRNVVTTEIPGYFLQTEMEWTVRVNIDGFFAEMVLNIDPENYGDNVVIEQGKRIIYKLLQQ